MKKNDIYYLIACAILILASISIKGYSHEVRVPLPQAIDGIPGEFGEFIGINEHPSDRNYLDSSADQWILRIYNQRGSDKPIRVFVGYWESQNEQKRVTPPRYTAEGWEYYWIKTKPLSLGTDAIVSVKEFLNEKGQEKELVYYCYIVDGKIVLDEYQLRLLNVVNLLLYRKSNAALVRLSVSVTTDFPVENAEVLGEKFLKEFLPLLKKYLS